MSYFANLFANFFGGYNGQTTSGGVYSYTMSGGIVFGGSSSYSHTAPVVLVYGGGGGVIRQVIRAILKRYKGVVAPPQFATRTATSRTIAQSSRVRVHIAAHGFVAKTMVYAAKLLLKVAPNFSHAITKAYRAAGRTSLFSQSIFSKSYSATATVSIRVRSESGIKFVNKTSAWADKERKTALWQQQSLKTATSQSVAENTTVVFLTPFPKRPAHDFEADDLVAIHQLLDMN